MTKCQYCFMTGWLCGILTLAFALSIFGCANDGVAVASTNNAEVPVTLLFEHDGCKAYRFHDVGEYRYYVRCPNSSTDTLGKHREGKRDIPDTVRTEEH